ncbi:cold-regulated 413 inner membrane protein 2, chloroplastic isoform X1 [Cryptomeria japonica]|uniref:cold-regulated 413 inner membrane protein 2, chloroplastic isoform X1 n=2 Tax=Cryptomeria japonica TaxID=3369 RepID=UPI0025AB8A31|nr:cold-regulated 413 inner membrane protein 2, chloroplastic isoform X1 [Cryptomeria japonica]
MSSQVMKNDFCRQGCVNMASATLTSALRPSLCKVSAGSFGVSRTRVAAARPLQLKSTNRASFTTLPSSLRSGSFFMGNVLSCKADKLGGRGKRGGTSSIQCARVDLLYSTEALRWLFAVSSVVLMFSKHTVIRKSFLVPLLALQAPGDVVSWIRGDYGLWTAFTIFLIRLFYPIPGEMELPLLFVLLVIIAPSQASSMRGTQASMVISIAISAYLSFQHFTNAGSVKKAFEQNSVVASIASLCLICVPIWFLIQGFIF